MSTQQPGVPAAEVPSIQWFPGHMAKTRRLMSESLKLVDIVVELIGGEHPATEIFTTAFENGKHVVSANKALLGRHVETLAEKARACGVQIKCEASCGGGIPIVSTLEHDLVGNKILTIAGILNGTTNYILSRMDAEGADYADVLADAQAKG